MARVDTQLQGFLVHDQRISLDTLQPVGFGATDSVYLQAGGRPGTAVPADSRGSFLPRVHAAQDRDHELYMIRGGMPGLDSAAALYREFGDTDEEYRGWNEHNLWQQYTPVDFSTTLNWSRVSAVTLPSTQEVVVAAVDTTGTEDISAWTWEPSGREWSARASIAGSSADRFVGLVVLRRSGQPERVLAIQAEAGSAIFRTHYSDDAGATWALYAPPQSTASEIAVDALMDHMSVAVDRHGNLMALFSDESTGDFEVFVSSDGGTAWEQTETGSALISGQTSISLLPSGALLLTFLKSGTARPAAITFEDAFDTLAGYTPVDMQTAAIKSMASSVDADGVAYAVAQSSASNDLWDMLRSDDEGRTWYPLKHSGIMRGGDYTPEALTFAGGEGVVLFRADMGISADGSLLSGVLGGWSNLEADTPNSLRVLRRGFGARSGATTMPFLLLPGDVLANQGFTLTGTAPTITGGYHRYSPAAATAYDSGVWTDVVGEMTVLAEIRVVSGGSQTATEAGFEIRRAVALGYDYQVAIQADATGFRVYDIHGAVSLGSVAFTMNSLVVQFMVVFADTDTLRVYYRRVGTTNWIAGPEGVLTDGGPLGASARIRVGCIASTTSTVDFGSIGVMDSAMRAGIADDAPYMERMQWGRPLSALPYPVRDQGDTYRKMRLSGVGGAARYAETFDLPAVYDYGIDRLLPQVAPSPAQAWRGLLDSIATQLVFQLGSYDTRLGDTFLWAFAFIGQCIPRTIVVEERASGAGAWTTLGTYDGATGFSSLTFARGGDQILPGAGTTAGARYVWEDEFVGGYVIIDPSGTPKIRKVLSNSAGYWTDDATLPRCAFRLDDIDDTEGASGTVHLVHPGGVLVVPQAFSAANLTRYIRISVSAQDLPDGYPTIGALVAGGVLVPGRQMNRGWSMRWSPRVESSEDDYGTTYVEQRGPLRREFVWSYQEVLNMLPLRNGAPDHVSAGASFAPEAAYGDVAHRLVGLLRKAKGGEIPVVGLLKLPESIQTVTDPTEWIYGVLQGQVQLNNVLGTPGTDEAWRVESLTLTELPWQPEGS